MAPDAPTPSFREQAIWLNERAKSTLVRDGIHAGMVFLRFSDGRLRPRLLGATDRAQMAAEWARLAADVRETGADGVVLVGEAWRAHEDAVPPGGGPSDVPDADEILTVAALESSGAEWTFETPFARDDEGRVALGETEETKASWLVLDGVREVWGLPKAPRSGDGVEPPTR